MTHVDEIAADIFRISLYVPEFDLQFNQFLIRDEEPLLFETDMKQMFPLVRESVASIIDSSSPRYVSLSRFEPDECGSLNEWLGFSTLDISANMNLGTLHLTIDGKAYKLREVGAGISQYIVVLGNAAMKAPDFIFIDEPETGLHPSLQKVFF